MRKRFAKTVTVCCLSYVEAINDYVINIEKDKMIGCVFNDVSELKLFHKDAEEQPA